MKKITAVLPITLVLTATAFARPQLHHPAATGSSVDSGYSAPRSWNEIEISHPEGGGN